MKAVSLCLLSIVLVFSLSTSVLGADKDAIQANVDGIVTAVNGGKAATEFNANDYSPYAFIMKPDGILIVHPSLAGQSLKEKAGPVFEALIQSTPDGVWVDYEWKGAMKHSYVRTTKCGNIVGSGYSD